MFFELLWVIKYQAGVVNIYFSINSTIAKFLENDRDMLDDISDAIINQMLTCSSSGCYVAGKTCSFEPKRTRNI